MQGVIHQPTAAIYNNIPPHNNLAVIELRCMISPYFRPVNIFVGRGSSRYKKLFFGVPPWKKKSSGNTAVDEGRVKIDRRIHF
jgi:hypothetical protein